MNNTPQDGVAHITTGRISLLLDAQQEHACTSQVAYHIQC